MKKLKKKDYLRLLQREGWYWWQFVCILAETEPPETVQEYLELKSKYKHIREKENELRSKGFFSDFNIPDIN